MKVIGKGGREIYICEVSHSEIEKYMGLYYGKMGTPSIGDIIDLGKGHDHSEKIETAMRKTAEMITANKDIIQAICDGITVAGNIIKKGEPS